MAPQNIMVKSEIHFFIERKTIVIVRIQIRLLIFMRLTAEKNKLIPYINVVQQ